MTFQVLGDTHVGRSFKTGVPLHRIGDREAMIWAQFEADLMGATAELHIHMGDLFDKFVVAPEVVLRAADLYLQAAQANPDVTYIILMGNHDPVKDALKKSSFDVFTRLVAGVTNIVVIQTPRALWGLGFLPYSVFGTAEESLQKLLSEGKAISAVFGHWDVVDWGGANVIPTASLARAGITEAFTGHDHLARVEKRHGVTINVVGSMQPYTHAEDGEGTMYVTLPLAEVEGQDWTNMNVRVLLGEDEVLPVGLDCLSLTAKRVGSSAPEDPVDTSEFDGIDLTAELSALLPESIRAEVMGVFQQ